MTPTEMNARTQWLPPLPEQFSAGYALGNYPPARVKKVMWKYLTRSQNCLRAWARINHHLPETLNRHDTLDILELSTAHGAMLEIWRDQGHRVTGTDFAWVKVGGTGGVYSTVRRPWQRQLLTRLTAVPHQNPTAPEVHGWVYQPIIESLGLNVRLHDGGVLPYPFEDNSFDVVCCYQAIEAYGSPTRWLDFIRDMCRIARKTVVIGFNPAPNALENNQTYQDACTAAFLEMQRLDHAGFRATHFEIGQTKRGIHPTVCKFAAQ